MSDAKYHMSIAALSILVLLVIMEHFPNGDLCLIGQNAITLIDK